MDLPNAKASPPQSLRSEEDKIPRYAFHILPVRIPVQLQADLFLRHNPPMAEESGCCERRQRRPGTHCDARSQEHDRGHHDLGVLGDPVQIGSQLIGALVVQEFDDAAFAIVSSPNERLSIPF